MNLIFRRNFAKLHDAALDALGATLPGRTLQVAGERDGFTARLAPRVAAGGRLDVVDAAAGALLPDETYDRAVLFFRLHGIPPEARQRALREAVRVVRPGGRIVIVDYHRPDAGHPLRAVLKWILRRLEPSALDLWDHEIAHWLPRAILDRDIRKETLRGGLYQKLVITT